MREAIKRLLPAALKTELKKWLPYALKQPNPALRQYGTVQEIYPWRADDELDTRAYVQNYFSVFFPQLDTATTLRLWSYDERGKPLGERTEKLAPRQTLEISMREWAGKGRGTMMWHIVMPEAVARRPECAEHHAYFTDRGYIAFFKRGSQVSYMHGIDRYAVFQKSEAERFDAYYPSNGSFDWRPEIPLGPALGCASMDVMTVNRCHGPATIELKVLDGDKKTAAAYTKTVPERGLFCQELPGELLSKLADKGSLHVTGLPTPWSRVMILRHFPTGAVAAMHC